MRSHFCLDSAKYSILAKTTKEEEKKRKICFDIDIPGYPLFDNMYCTTNIVILF